MKINLLLLIFYLFPFFAYGQQGQARREIPASWIEKLQKYDYKTSANDLVREFQTYIAPDSLHEVQLEALLSHVFVNVDADTQEELLLFIGGEDRLRASFPHFFVIKKIKKRWYVLYKEEVYEDWHNPPNASGIKVAEDSAQNKVFYFSYLANKMEDEYRTRFFKIDRNNNIVVIDVLLYTIPYHYEGSLFIQTHFSFVANTVVIVYSYSCKVNEINENKESTGEMLLLSLPKKDTVKYAWDYRKGNYTVVATENTLRRLNCNENLRKIYGYQVADYVVCAFEEELENIKKNGTEAEKKALKQFYKNIKKD